SAKLAFTTEVNLGTSIKTVDSFEDRIVTLEAANKRVNISCFNIGAGLVKDTNSKFSIKATVSSDYKAGDDLGLSLSDVYYIKDATLALVPGFEYKEAPVYTPYFKWKDSDLTLVDSTNGTFQAKYTTTPKYNYSYGLATDGVYLYAIAIQNQAPNFKELKQPGATNLRFWVDNDPSSPARSALFDFTYDGQKAVSTKDNFKNGIKPEAAKPEDKINPEVHSKTEGGKYFVEVKIKLADLGITDKEFAICFSMSDLNLTDTGDAYDALHNYVYTKGQEPWTTTAGFKKYTVAALPVPPVDPDPSSSVAPPVSSVEPASSSAATSSEKPVVPPTSDYGYAAVAILILVAVGGALVIRKVR
ncbi:MAG: hypothetical protein RR246_04485, partial [Clostridia bacterium]